MPDVIGPCVAPCTQPTLPPGIKIPFAGSLQASHPIDLKLRCGSCDAVTGLFNQVNPVLTALGMPLKIISCLGSIIKVLTDITGVFTFSPPFIDTSKVTSMLSDAEAIPVNCAFILQIAVPGVGITCDFVGTLTGIVSLLRAMVDCLRGIISHLSTASLQANIMINDTSPAVRAAGHCHLGMLQAQEASLSAKLVAAQAVAQVLDPLISLIEVLAPGSSSTLDQIKTGLDTLTGNFSGPAGNLPGKLTALTEFEAVLTTVLSVLTPLNVTCGNT